MPTDGMNQDQNGQGNEQGAGAGGAGAGAGGAGNAGAGADGGAAQNAGAGNAAAAGEGKQPGNDGGNAGNGAAGQGGQQGGTQGEGGAQKEGGQAQGAGAEPWAKIEDEAVRTVAQGKSYEQLAKELHGAQSLIGKKSVGIPNKDSKPEEWKAFHKARGVPEDEAGYDFTTLRDEALKDIPEDQRDAAWDKDEEAYWRGVFKNSNVSQTEAAEIMRRGLEKRMGEFTATAEAERKVGKQVSDKITEEWGPKKDEYTQDANNFARHIGLEDDMVDAMMKLPGVTADTRYNLLEFMRTQGALLREGGQTGRPGAAPTAGNMTPEQARTAKEQYLDQGDNREAYMESSHPRHKEVTTQVTTYLKIERGQGKS